METSLLLVLAVACFSAEGMAREIRGSTFKLEAEHLKTAMVIPDVPRMKRRKRSSNWDGYSLRPLTFERPGSSTEDHECGTVSSVPYELRSPANMYPDGLDSFYQKYTHAYRIPIIGSRNVSDTALKRACYLMRFLLADRPDVRESFYKMFGRFAIIAHHEVNTDIPEHGHLNSDQWNTRGLGGTRNSPVTTGGEENALCFKDDRYVYEDILLHELVHAVHLLGAQYAIRGFDARLKGAYNYAKSRGLWENTYAMTNPNEYFAEAAQSYFNDNDMTFRSHGVYHDLSTREKLRAYDPNVYNLLQEIWPCRNKYLLRCLSSRDLEQAQVLQMNCNGVNNNYFSYYWRCIDSNFPCPDWAMRGECHYSYHFMQAYCPRSCRRCTTTYRGKAYKGRKSAVVPLSSCTDAATNCSPLNCTSDINYSTKQCRGTCIACNRYVAWLNGTCSDDHEECNIWAANGDCRKNPEFMLSYCKKSCNICSGSTSPRPNRP